VRREIKGKDSKGGEAARNAQRDAPLTLLAFRNTVDHFVGRLTACRVFSGSVKHGTVNREPAHRAQRDGAARVPIDGNRTTEVPEAAAGEIIGLMKLKDVHVGDTLCSNDSPGLRLDMIPAAAAVIAYALKIDREQEEKVGVALHRLLEEDPSLEMVRDPETNETLLRGMGQVAHRGGDREAEAEVRGGRPSRAAAPRLPRDHHPARPRRRASTSARAVAVGSTATATSSWSPCRADPGSSSRRDVGGVIPRNFIPSVEHGIRDAAKQGPLVGFRWWISRSRSSTDRSTPWTARTWRSHRGLDGAEERARLRAPVLLEPMMRLEVVVPDEMLGEVIADLTSRRGKIFGMEPTSKGTLIHAQAPHAELRTYAPSCARSPRAWDYFTMEITGLRGSPTHEAQKVLAQRAAEQGKDEPKPNQPGKGRA